MKLSFHNLTLLAWVDVFLADYPEAKVYVVGGAVRDALRGRETHDYDLVVSNLAPDKLEAWLSAHGKVSFVGKRFGVWKFSPYHDPSNPEIDIALPRKEISIGGDGGYRQFIVESDPILPIEEDLSRRDFTINAIAYDWREQTLVDPFNGQGDLREQIIRAVGNPIDRLTEDSSRMLRALRFACVLGFAIDSKTWEAIQKLASRLALEVGGRRVVARELVSEEFFKAFSASPKKCLELYSSSGAWSELFGGLMLTSSLEIFTRLGQARKNNPEVNLALLCLHLFPSARETYEWLHAWSFETVLNIKPIIEVVRVIHTDPDKVSLAQTEKNVLPHTALLLPFFEVVRGSREYVDVVGSWMAKIVDAKKLSYAPPLVRGDDLKQMGIYEGPIYADLLDKIRSVQLAGKIKTREDALTLAAKYLDRFSS